MEHTTPTPTPRQAAFEALPDPLKNDVQLTMLVADALAGPDDRIWAIEAAANLVGSWNVREAAAAAVAGGAQ
jgi:hypothetical protein